MTSSPEFIKARNDFEAWYDSHSEEVKELIDLIAEETTFILEESAYDAFVSELSKLGINHAAAFQTRFYGEFEGITGEPAKAAFAEWLIDECGFEIELGFDGVKVWNEKLSKEYSCFEFIGHSYFFRKAS